MLTLDVCNDSALRSWILGWGPSARVVAPASLAAGHPRRPAKRQRAISSLTCADPFRFVVLGVLALALPRRAVAAPLLHGLALVRRGRLPAGLHDDRRSEASLFTIVFVISVALARVQPAAGARRRSAIAGRSSRRARHRGRAARPPAAADDRVGDRDGPRGAHRALRLLAVGDVADVAARRAVRPGRIRSSAATSPSTSSRCPSCSSCAGSRRRWSCWRRSARGGALSGVRQPDSGFPRVVLDDAAGAPASVAARRAVLPVCWRSAPGSGASNLLVHPAGVIYGAVLRRRRRPDAGGAGAHRCRVLVAACSPCARVHAPQLADPGRGRRSTCSSASAAKRYSTLLQRFVVTPNEQARESPFIQHNIDATRRAFALDRVEERALSGDALLTRDDITRNADDARERAALGSPAAARHVRPDPGDPHLLRLRVGGQRPLPHQRPPAAGDAVGARAEFGQPAQPHLGQRAADLHARLRPHARPGQPGDQRRAAGAVRPQPADRDDPRSADCRSRASTSASSRTTT